MTDTGIDQDDVDWPREPAHGCHKPLLLRCRQNAKFLSGTGGRQDVQTCLRLDQDLAERAFPLNHVEQIVTGDQTEGGGKVVAPGRFVDTKNFTSLPRQRNGQIGDGGSLTHPDTAGRKTDHLQASPAEQATQTSGLIAAKVSHGSPPPR